MGWFLSGKYKTRLENKGARILLKKLQGWYKQIREESGYSLSCFLFE